ncbi:hypothetical protein C7974DRAFT_407224, partial [Boeremia exigua]|uniref:uncharacterized protein n=1 Tax=Boeremia exigua TaxID=749465 RepID=UPI001E8CF88D
PHHEMVRDHAEELWTKSGIHSLFRASDASKPFLTFPVLDDTGFLLSDEFKSISPISTILPGTGNVQSTMSKKGNGEKVAKSIVTVEIQPPTGLEADEINAFFDKQINTLNEESGYTRSLVFESCSSFASAGGKKQEGSELEKQHELPSWVVIHTFSGVVSNDVVKRIELDVHKMDESIGDLHGEVKGWSLQGGFGEKKLFE